MKQAKLVELVDNVNSFGDVWDAAEEIFNSDSQKTEWTAKDFEFIFKPDNVVCNVMNVQKKVTGKEASYKHTLVGKESGETIVEAFKNAVQKYLIK